MNITVVGGGNSAHSLIPLLASAGHHVRLLTRRPAEWAEKVTMHYILPTGEEADTLVGRLCRASDRPEDVVPASDVVILCLPVSQYRTMLHDIGPYVDRGRDVFVGAIYGQAGVNWMVSEMTRAYEHNRVRPFTFGLVPWITRTRRYGSDGINYGPKKINLVATARQEDFDRLNEEFLKDVSERWFGKGRFERADNFISLTLSVDNQIIHLSRLYGLYLTHGGAWDSRDAVPSFYRELDETSANILGAVDNEYEMVRSALRSRFPLRNFPYMLDYLSLDRLCNGICHPDIRSSFVNSSTLWQIDTPTVANSDGKLVLDRRHRYFTDDLYYGLCIGKWMACQMGIKTETIDRIIDWAQSMLGDRIMENGHLVPISQIKDKYRWGIPPVYGIDNVEDAVD